MKFRSVQLTLASFAVAIALVVLACSRQPSLAGDWDATIVNLAKAEVPFRFVIGGTRDQPTGTFVNGDERMASTSGSFTDGQLTIAFDQYGSKIVATLKGDTLEGEYNRSTRGASYPFKAKRHTEPKKDANPPQIAGEWKIPTPSEKYEAAWTFIVRQSGADVTAAVQRVDGDTGTLTGSWQGGKLVMSHFSGARPMRLEVTPNPDGTLALVEDGQEHRTAIRATDPRVANVDAKDPTQLTRAKDPKAALNLTFPDLDGKPVSLTDPRFQGKVVILSITGSWCPNCHDEAPFLSELYKRYKDKGLEIVLLAFEEAKQLATPGLPRLRAFLKQYDIKYPVLVAGEPKDLAAKLPQFDNLVAFPTSIYIGRDGRVRATHAGFSSKATGALYTKTTEEITEEVETLLAENSGGEFDTGAARAKSSGGEAPAKRLDVRTSVKRRNANGGFDLVADVTPAKGMHVYAPGAKDYRVIALDVVRTPGLAVSGVNYPKAEDFFFKPLNEHVAVYQKPFRLVLPVAAPATTTTVTGTLSYQACDDKLCYLPESIPVTFSLAEAK